jgi:hypothetical protein
MKGTWASIVKKPPVIVTELTPMQVVVPEPPMRSQAGGNEPPIRGIVGNESPIRGIVGNESPIRTSGNMGGNATTTVTTVQGNEASTLFSIKSILDSLDSQKATLEAEMLYKKEKFHNSYAYTKYMNDMTTLSSERLIIDKKKHYVQSTLDVMKRIQTYLKHGPTSAQTLTYTVQHTTDPNNNEISWSIKEGIHATTLHIDFLTDYQAMLPILEVVINSELASFIKN